MGWAGMAVQQRAQHLECSRPRGERLSFQRLRACSDVPVVMISPLADDQERTWGLRLGADDYVPRPRVCQRAGGPFLAAHPARAFRREELLEAIWGYTVGDLSTVTVYVRRLREKIEPDPAPPAFIVTLWGVGYRFDPQAVPTTGAMFDNAHAAFTRPTWLKAWGKFPMSSPVAGWASSLSSPRSLA